MLRINLKRYNMLWKSKSRFIAIFFKICIKSWIPIGLQSLLISFDKTNSMLIEVVNCVECLQEWYSKHPGLSQSEAISDLK